METDMKNQYSSLSAGDYKTNEYESAFEQFYDYLEGKCKWSK